MGRFALWAALAASLIANVWLDVGWSRKAAEAAYYTVQQPLIDKAVALFVSELPGKPDRQHAMRHRFPVVSQIPDPRLTGKFLVCVTLKLRRGMLGFDPVYCFDDGGALVSHARI